jgi:hypothetical protein
MTTKLKIRHDSLLLYHAVQSLAYFEQSSRSEMSRRLLPLGALLAASPRRGRYIEVSDREASESAESRRCLAVTMITDTIASCKF